MSIYNLKFRTKNNQLSSTIATPLVSVSYEEKHHNLTTVDNIC